MTDFLINVIVDPSKAVRPLDKVDDRLRKAEESGKRLRNTLARAFTLVGIIAAARQVGQFADTLTNAANRIRLVTKNNKELSAVMQRLFDISARTRTGFSSTATIFSRTALAVKDLGLSLQETLDFTESLNQAIVLSGVKAQEANAGLIQLSQGLASGTLRGDELRSVLEQLPKVADLIADQLGVLRGELRLMGEQGLISTKDIIKAFTGLAASDLVKAFGESIPTISQGFSVLQTRIIQYIGEADSAHGISEKLARSLIFIAENLETIGKFALVAGAALGGPFAKAGVLFATRAVQALTVAIIANPIGALIALVLAAVTAIMQFGDSLAVSEDGLLSLKDVALGTWQAIMDSMQPVADFITDAFEIAINFVISAFGDLNITFDSVLKHLKNVVNRIIGFHVGMAAAMRSVFRDIRTIIVSYVGSDLLDTMGALVSKFTTFMMDSLGALWDFMKGILTGLGVLADELSTVVDGLDLSSVDTSFSGNMAKVAINAKDAFFENFGKDFVGDMVALVAPAFKTIEENARKISAKRRAAPGPGEGVDLSTKGTVSTQKPLAFREMIRLLEAEAINLSLVSRERGIANELLKAEEKLRAKSVTLTPALREELEDQIKLITVLREKAAVLDSLQAPQIEITARQDALNTLYAEGAISLAQLTTEMLNLGTAQSELNIMNGEGSFMDGFMLGIDGMLEGVRNFASEAGSLMGDFFAQSTEGFGDAIGNALAFGTSIKDALGQAARSAIADLLSGLIKMGLQFALNAAMGTAAATAATAVGVAQAASLATAYATPAALASLSSYGANAAPAQAGILSTVSLSQGIAAVGKGFKDGGIVHGAGDSRSDSIDAKLSRGEFVVDAKATARNRPQLEAMLTTSKGSTDPTAQSGGGNFGGGSGSGDAPQGGNVNIINLLDPAMVDDYISSAAGDRTILNSIERNATGIKALIGNS